jgi:choline-sulfatase
MGFLGSARGLTPELDAFARTATVFTRAYSQAPITTVSHATILTGTYPPFHRVTDFGTPLSPGVPYLPDILHHAGYQTAAFVGSLILDPRAGTAPGFDRGFDVYDAGFRLRQPGDDRYQTVERRGDEVVRRATAWLASAPRGPWFLWVHLFDAHDPYDPPADLKKRFASAPYDGEIASVDRLAARIVRAAGPDAVVAIAADHGEALGDHGEKTHGVFLYDETLHVPLVVRAPGHAAPSERPQRIAARVRLADLAPTLLEAAGVAVPREMQGESLFAARADRPVYSETDYPRYAFGWSALASWRAEQFLFVRAPARELYDVTADPAAARNIAESRSRVADGIDAEIEQFIRRTAAGSMGATRAKVDPALAERLASLGYVGGSGGAPTSSRIDPKDRIRVANDLQTAISAVEDAQWTRAIPLLEHVVASDPAIPIAQLNLGIAYARTKQPARAAASLEKAIALGPISMIGHYERANALYEQGDLQRAADEFGVVAKAMPQWADARYSLGSVYARINRVADAVSELTAALALEPKHFRANLLLGRIDTLQGRAADAIPRLQTAVDVQPSNAEAHSFLADAYEKNGNAAGAAKERDRARALTKHPDDEQWHPGSSGGGGG